MEADVAETQRRPRNQPSNGTQTQQPVKRISGTARPETQIRQRAKQPRGNNSNVRHTVLGRAAKKLRQLAVRRHGDDHAGAYPAVRVTGAPGADEDTGVDDGGEDIDAGLADGDDPRGGVCVAGIGDEALFAGIDDEGDEECTEDVEEADAPCYAASGVGDGFVGVD